MRLEDELRLHIIKEHLPGEDPALFKLDHDLIGSGILDSLSLMNLVTYLEKTYGIKVKAGEINPDNFGSVAAIARFINGKRPSQQEQPSPLPSFAAEVASAPIPTPMVTSSPSGWDEYYQGIRVPDFIVDQMWKNFETVVRRHLGAARDLVVVELGGADSNVYERLRKTFPVAQYHIIDNNQVGLDMFKHKSDSGVSLHNIDLLNGDCPDLGADLVISFGLIEHFTPDDTRKIIRKHFDMLKPDGLVFMSFPAPTAVYWGFRRMLEAAGKFPKVFERPVPPQEAQETLKVLGTPLENYLLWGTILTQTITLTRKEGAKVKVVREDLSGIQWDDIIVGTGMGGATCGYQLAGKGRKVLFLEQGADQDENVNAIKGDFLEARSQHPGAKEFRNAGRLRMDILDVHKGRRVEPLLGSGTGGSSALYGMVMERFWPQDFEPRRFHPNADPDSTLPQRWPIGYHELEPYYRDAESLYRVCTRYTDPMRAGENFNYRFSFPTPDDPREQRFKSILERKGLHPYSNPLALDWAEECRLCQSSICDKHCKNDAAKICLNPALKNHGAALLADCEVTRLEADYHRVSRVHAQIDGRMVSFVGKNIILGAGALSTPMLLQRSSSQIWPNGLGNRSGLVGRNLMRHYIDLLALFSRARFSPKVNMKVFMFNDFYLVNGEKYGSVGAFGQFPPASMLVNDIEKDLRQEYPQMLPLFRSTKGLTQKALEGLFSHAGFLALVLEDLPFADNRVVARTGGAGDIQAAIEYTVRPSERARIDRFRTMVQKVFWPNPQMLLKQADNLKFLAHACGTCRFGDDPKTSVLDRNNRCHDLENLYVVDSSFFPSSGGVNPALTIAANGLRVADHIAAL